MPVTTLLTSLRDAAVGWWEDGVPNMAAALAFYTLFSLAPLVVVAIMIAGVVFGEEAAAGQLVAQLEGIVGHTAGQVIQAAIANAHRPHSGVLPTLMSVLISLFAAAGVFHQLGDALDRVWKCPPKRPSGDKSAACQGTKPLSFFGRVKQAAVERIKAQFWAFAMVVGIGLSLLLSLFASTLLASLGRHTAGLNGEGIWLLGRVVDLVVSVGLGTLAFALIYKVLPSSKLAWRDLWLGAFIAAILFTLGRWLIGLYLAHSTVASVYGAAGALVVLMIWTWCSAMVLLFGAELCQAHARRHGRTIGRTRAGHSPTNEIFAGYGS
jgi:membrane protein